ncbi:MAG: hypothetical protein AAGA91_18225 [Pseudomonadota bacterium]
MNVVETEWWTMALPPEWWAESEDDSVLVGDRDEVGCIEISTLCKEEGEFDVATVRKIAQESSDQAQSWRTAELGAFNGVFAGSLEQGVALREWYVAAGQLLLFITYSCDEDNGGMDDAAVDAILDTLQPAVR